MGTGRWVCSSLRYRFPPNQHKNQMRSVSLIRTTDIGMRRLQYQIVLCEHLTELPRREFLETIRIRLAEYCHRWSAGTSKTFTGTGEPYNRGATRAMVKKS